MRKKLSILFGSVLGLLGMASAGFAEEAATINWADNTWIIMCSALVLLMIPGLGFFYAGMVRKKNVLSTLMHSLICMGVVSILWVLYGYSTAFGTDISGLFGGCDFLMFKGVGAEEANGSISHMTFAIFQMMFAIITAALITGAIAERVKFGAMVLFVALWATLIYNPLCHWVWGGGWIGDLGALDFAGGTVVHISSGISALVFALVLGKRKSIGKEPILPNNLSMTVLGAGLLWFGWFGFNAGSELAMDGVATNAFLVTHMAASAGILGWCLLEKLGRGKSSVLGGASGAVAGLVAITPASGFVGVMPAIIIGLVAGGVCYYGVQLKSKMGYDDALDVFGVHAVGGTWGALATGLFASTAVNSGGADGLFYGGGVALLIKQVIAIGATVLFAGIGTFIILKVVQAIMGLRVSESEEEEGLDISQHGEEGYTL